MAFRSRSLARALFCAAALLGGFVACSSEPGSDVAAHTEIPAEGSCEAAAMLTVANEASETELDDLARLDSRAAANIVAARPIETLKQLDLVAYVGSSAMHKILDYAEAEGHLAACSTGNCDESAVLSVANELTQEQLDDDVGLDSRAAKNIVEARPLATYEDLDQVGYVGTSALGKLLAYAIDNGFVTACAGGGSAEIGIVSDLDKTVVPPADPDLSKAPYPGVSTLYQILERRNGGQDGDMHYVTARQPEMVEEIPSYLEEHGVPTGSIDTGVSGLPWVAEPEKVSDVSGVLDATGTQRFVLFGDSSHVDPGVYQTIRETYGDRIIAGFIHKVTATIAPDRVEGLHLHEGYAEVAAILYGYEVITRAEALSVMQAAQDEGFAITDSEMQDLLDEHAP